MSAEPVTRGPGLTFWTRLGLCGALLVYAGLVMLWMTAVPLFATGDESAHVDYAHAVAEGRIPLVDSPRTQEFPELGQVGRRQYVSNHPPLYHALVAPLVSAADLGNHPRAFLLLARGVTAGMGALTVLLVAATARTMFRTRRAAAVATITSAGVTGSAAALVGASGSIRNDPLTVLLVAAVVLALARALRHGMGRRTVVVVSVLCALGMLTRIAFLPMWLLAVAAVTVLHVWPHLQGRRPAARDLLHGLVPAAVVVAGPLLGAGWFYALSLSRYGDLTGGSAVYPRVAERSYAPGAEDGALAYLLQPSTWWSQVKQLGGAPASLAGHDHAVHGVLGLLTLGILGLLAVAALRRRRGSGQVFHGSARWTVTALAVLAAATIAELAVHVSHKGVDSQRYLLNGIGFWALGCAAVVALAPRRWVPPAVTLVAALSSVAGVLFAADTVARRTDVEGGSWFALLTDGVTRSGLPAGPVVVASLLLLVAVGLVCLYVALAGACRPTARTAPDAPFTGAADRAIT